MILKSYADRFHAGLLDPELWTTGQIEPHQIGFSPDSPDNDGQSLTITTRDGDGGLDCDQQVPCQRAEIRQHGRLRPLHSAEFWQGFSFRVTGSIAETGSLRTVIAQWKAPGDDSPFLAQRFDNGVFHVTVQNGHARHVTATALGDPDQLEEYQDIICTLAAQEGVSPADLNAAAGTFRPGAGPENREQLERICRKLPRGERLAALMARFFYIHELGSYAARTGVEVRNPHRRILPDPRACWVRMAYRIKAGATRRAGPAAPGRSTSGPTGC